MKIPALSYMVALVEYENGSNPYLIPMCTFLRREDAVVWIRETQISEHFYYKYLLVEVTDQDVEYDITLDKYLETMDRI